MQRKTKVFLEVSAVTTPHQEKRLRRLLKLRMQKMLRMLRMLRMNF